MATRLGFMAAASLILTLQLPGMSAFAQPDAPTQASHRPGLTTSEIMARLKDAQAHGNELTVLDLLRSLEAEYADHLETSRRIAGRLI